ncbi:MAG: hypothetical protein M3N41_12865, partial [Acidobacteriota bacterium]|nr:hypothetical protein [Acidobacteriota bacterium]
LFWGAVFEGYDKPRLAPVLGACILAFQWGALQHNLSIRTEAAELSRRVCTAIGEELRRDPRSILAEELPRTWKGVYFLSNGFDSCVAIQAGAPEAMDRLLGDTATTPALSTAHPAPRIFRWNADAQALVEIHPSGQ